MGKDALTVVSKVLTRVAAYAFDPAALVEAEHVVAYRVEISMVAIMVARPEPNVRTSVPTACPCAAARQYNPSRARSSCA